ncbi:MAG: LDCC motif putative metal-binding protein [Cyclobacteriaceae bacterium]
MDDFVITHTFTSAGQIPDEVWNAIRAGLEVKEGVSYKKADPDQVSVSFPAYLYAPEYISGIVLRSGFKEKPEEKRSFWKTILDFLASDTDNSFGTRRLDCCSLNRYNQTQGRGRSKYLKSSTRFQKQPGNVQP